MTKLLKKLENADRVSMRIGPVEDCTKVACHLSQPETQFQDITRPWQLK
jgi:hypothetical protein